MKVISATLANDGNGLNLRLIPVTHQWERASEEFYPTNPPKYDWWCSKCGSHCVAEQPPTHNECPGMMTSV